MRIIPITNQNRKEAEALQVQPFQINYIESVAECMQEADEIQDWHPVGLYVDEELVGFAMYGNISEPKYTRLWFDRLLIDQRYQSRGYGSLAFEIVLEEIKKTYPGKDIYLSVYDDNIRAIQMYIKHGFAYTGELDTKGEKIMKYQ